VLWGQLRAKRLGGSKWRRQYGIDPYIVDFCCTKARLVVELDGAGHDHEAAQDEDEARDRRLAASGWRVLRFENREVMDELEGVLITIQDALVDRGTLPPSPSPSPLRGEGG